MAPDELCLYAEQTMVTGPSFVDVKNIVVDYPVPANPLGRWLGRAPDAYSALHNISFQMNHDDALVLYGAEGSGKSTLLRVLTGVLQPTSGRIIINGKKPLQNSDSAAGYVSSAESEPSVDTVYAVLHAFGMTHGEHDVSRQVSQLLTKVGLDKVAYRSASGLSTAQLLRLNLARAAMSDAPVILLDDVADQLGPVVTRELLRDLFPGRATIIATRRATVADHLQLPLLMLHDGALIQTGTRDEIALAVAAPRTLDVWIEGLRYDLLRKLKRMPGVSAVKLITSNNFSGQRLQITLISGRYLATVYDALSVADVIRVKEVPPSLADIVRQISRRSS